MGSENQGEKELSREWSVAKQKTCTKREKPGEGAFDWGSYLVTTGVEEKKKRGSSERLGYESKRRKRKGVG